MRKIIIFSGLILLLVFMLWWRLAKPRTAESNHSSNPAQAQKTIAPEPAAQEASQENRRNEDGAQTINKSQENPAHDAVDVFGIVSNQEGSPIGGAEVKAFQGTEFDRGTDISATTSKDGTYSLSGLHFPSTYPYQVVAFLEGYAPAFSEPFYLNNPPKRIDLTLTKGASLSGRVMDESLKGIPGAVLQLEQGPLDLEMRETRTETDADGAYVFENVSPGQYWFFVSAKGYIDQRRAIVVAPHGTQPAQDFLLEYAGEGYCSGVVLDENDQPLEGVEVNGDQYHVGALRTGSISHTCNSTANGSFLLEGFVPRGSGGKKVPILLKAAKEGYRKSEATVFSGDEKVLIHLQKDLLGSISGRVVEAVEGDSPPPVTEFQVEVLWQNTLSDFRHFQSHTGEFLFSNIEEGRYHLHISAPNRAPHFEENLFVKSGEETSVGLIRLARGATITGKIRGKGQMEPLAGAMVYIKTGMNPQYLRILTGASTDETGFYRLEGVPPGPQHVLASHPDYATAISPELHVLEGKEYSNIDLVLGNGGAIEGVVTDEGIPLAGQRISITPVASDSSGRNKVLVRRIYIQADENGYYHKDRLMPGLYFCFTRIPSRSADVTGEGNSVFDALEIVEGETTRFDITLGVGGFIKGKVVSEAPIPPQITGVMIALHSIKMGDANTTTEEVHDISTSLGSSYSFDNVCPGEYFIQTLILYDTPEGERALTVPHSLNPPGKLVVEAGKVIERDIILTYE